MRDAYIKESVNANTNNAWTFVRRYGLSLIVILIAFFLTKILWPVIQPAPVPLFFAAILAAFWGGFGPGLFASVICALLIDFFFIPPFDQLDWTFPNLIRMGVFIAVSSLVSWLNTTRKRLMDERSRLLTQIEGFNYELRREVQSATQELVQTNDALLKTQQHLARSERLAVVGQMAASLAHEIGTPLNAISGHLELLGGNKANDTETRRRIRIIRQQLDFIVGTVKRLLEWTHKRTTNFEAINLDKLIQETLWLVSPTLEQRSIRANFRSINKLPVIEGERESLQQVFLNLINNSIEAMPDGGLLEIGTQVAPSKTAIEIIFEDSGPGIAADDARHLFEPMWTTKPFGSGFGLAIARETMTDHGGEIQVVAGQSKGAVFKLSLPINHMKAESLSKEAAISHVA